MKQFAYRVRKQDGAILSGVIESLTPASAARTLQERKYLVLDVKEKRAWDLKTMIGGGLTQKVSGAEVAQFTRLLATMLSTGLPLTDALSNLIAQTKNNYFRQVLQSILHDVQAGVSISEAMTRTPNVFDELYVNLVKSGEASGKVDEALGKLADTLEANLDFKSKVKGAMIYPAVIVLAMGGIGIFMITSIIPKIADVYKEFGADLPLPTKVLIAISNFLTNYTIIVFVLLGLLYYTYRALKKNPNSEFLLNNLFFKIPVFGSLNWEVSLAVICRTLGTLLSSGVAILDALRIVSRTVGNNSLRAGLREAGSMVEKGLPLSLSLRRNPDFPMMMSQLVAIGEIILATGASRITPSILLRSGFSKSGESGASSKAALTSVVRP